MKDADDFKSIWLQKISLIRDRKRSGEFQAYVDSPDRMKDRVLERIKAILAGQDFDEEKQERIYKILEQDPDLRGYFITHKAIIKAYKELLNVELQVRKSDLESKSRFLLFRILTAIGIALVVLGTGYVAHKAGIPLPLLRVAT